jgi:hypothetical protein
MFCVYLISAGYETVRFEIHKLINSVSNKETLPPQRKELFFVTIHKEGDKTAHRNYRAISLLSTPYNVFPIDFCQG